MDTPRVLLSTVDDQIAMEKARLVAAQNLANNPAHRKVCEDRFGVEYCRNRWPEAYKPTPFFRSLIDRLTWRTF